MNFHPQSPLSSCCSAVHAVACGRERKRWFETEELSCVGVCKCSKEAAQLTSYVVWPRMDDVRNSIEVHGS